jgi:hypothetical protein
MREYASAVSTFLGDLRGVKSRALVWIRARNRSTGALEETGFWNGADAQDFVIGGVTRTYYGAGALMQVPPIKGGVGLNVQMHDLMLSGVPPEVLQLIHGYDTRLAPVEIHRAIFDPETDQLLAEPHRLLKGAVENMDVPRPVPGESGEVTITVASAARALTRTLTTNKSDAAQRTINPNDRGREYASISGAVGVFWGVKNSRAAPPPTTPSTDGGREIPESDGTSGQRR